MRSRRSFWADQPMKVPDKIEFKVKGKKIVFTFRRLKKYSFTEQGESNG